jgi:hypothetical protein
MYEKNINDIVFQTNDLLDILKVYIDYRTTFLTERVLNRLRVLSDVAWFPGTFEFNDVGPVHFDVLTNAYFEGYSKDMIIRANQLSINELNKSIINLMM